MIPKEFGFIPEHDQLDAPCGLLTSIGDTQEIYPLERQTVFVFRHQLYGIATASLRGNRVVIKPRLIELLPLHPD